MPRAAGGKKKEGGRSCEVPLGRGHNSSSSATYPPRSMHLVCTCVLVLCSFSVLFLLLPPFVVVAVFRFVKKKCAVMHCRLLQLAPRTIDGSNYNSQNRTVYLAGFTSVVATNCSLRIYNKALFSNSRRSM